MKRPNSDQCLAYDPSIMANTVEEVIQNFPDLAGAFVSAKPQLKEVKVGDVLYQVCH